MPPHLLGLINDVWSRYVTDVGNAAPDKGQGGKYLLLPPGSAGAVPDGYFVARSRTFGNLLAARGFAVNGDLRPAVASVRQHLRIYPLADAADPPAMTFVDISGAAFNMIPANARSVARRALLGLGRFASPCAVWRFAAGGMVGSRHNRRPVSGPV